MIFLLRMLFYSFFRRQGETESESWPAGAPGAPRGDHGAPRGSREAWGAQEGGPTLWETLWGIPGAPRETLWGTLWGYYRIPNYFINVSHNVFHNVSARLPWNSSWNSSPMVS